MFTSSKRPILGYWNQRGLAQPIRLALTYLNVDFEDKRYSRGEDGKGSEWFSPEDGDKFSLNLPFPNLPYYITETGEKITQSISILRYIGFKYNLDGKTTEEKNRVNLIEREISDLMAEFFQLTQRPNYKDIEYDYLEILEKVKLTNVVNFLGDRKFVAGDFPTISDFLVYEQMIRYRTFAPQVWEKFSTLEAYVKRIEELPRIKEYIAATEPLIFSGSAKYFWNAKY